ncbi:hypothetical protein [uncultured Microbacterium sp.]|uniref:hypothetical protein n=1 Tax=uncultured Microbacterium sp. TaxID=191216 RepID=UPI002611C059|nr:hypothetical protein [uncultured Microbacterium sp.]
MPFNPLYMTESKLTLGDGANDFAAEISGATLVPSSSSATWKGLKPGSVFTGGGLATWVLTVNVGQDHELSTSLSNYLYDNEGETVPFSLEPIAGGTGFSGSLVVQAATIGAEVDSFGTASVTMPVQGKPTRTLAGA